MNAAHRLIGEAHDYEVLAASHSERGALVGGGEHLAAATAFTVAAIIDRLETAAHLRRLNRVRAMERVRDLSWRSVFPSPAVEARTGFETVSAEVPEPLRRKLDELRARSRKRVADEG